MSNNNQMFKESDVTCSSGFKFNLGTVFPHIVSAETIFLNLEIVANSNSCRNISIST